MMKSGYDKMLRKYPNEFLKSKEKIKHDESFINGFNYGYVMHRVHICDRLFEYAVAIGCLGSMISLGMIFEDLLDFVK